MVEKLQKRYITHFNTFAKRNVNITQLTYKILDGLYRRTIMNKVIRKYISSIVPPFFNIHVEDENGDRVLEIEKALKPLNRMVNRTFLSEVEKYFFLYGTAIVYTGNIENDLFLLNEKDLTVRTSTDVDHLNEIIGFDYAYYGKNVFIPLSDVAIVANDPDTDELFGHSIMEHTLDTLHQYLNDNLALAQILDQYSDPILLWLIDVSELQMTNEDEFIAKVKHELWTQLDNGDDVVTDARVTPELVEFSQTASHLVDILKQARTALGMLTIPQSLMGGPADNLSAIKVQVGFYYEEINNYKAILNDFVVEKIYKPYLEKKGFIEGEDYHNIFIGFGIANAELPSDSIIWLKTAFESGVITLDEFRAALGYRGKAPGVTSELEEHIKVQTLKDESVDDPYNKTTPQPSKNGSDPDQKR